MADSTTNLDTIATGQSQKEATANELIDAASPSTFGGNHSTATSGLTWGYYGGKYFDGSGAIQNLLNGTVTLTASATNYVEFNNATGLVTVNTSAFTSGRMPLYKIVTGPSSISSYTDERCYAPSSAGGGGTAPGAIPVSHQTGNYTPVLGDAPQSSGYQGAFRMDSTSANALTIPPHSSVAYPVGAVLYAIQWNTGQTSLAAGSGVTIRNPSSLNCRAQYSTISAMQTDTVDTWVAMGDLA
jgi:hypothetical protein